MRCDINCTCLRQARRRCRGCGRCVSCSSVHPCAEVLLVRRSREEVEQKSKALLSRSSAAQRQSTAEVAEVQRATTDAVEQAKGGPLDFNRHPLQRDSREPQKQNVSRISARTCRDYALATIPSSFRTRVPPDATNYVGVGTTVYQTHLYIRKHPQERFSVHASTRPPHIAQRYCAANLNTGPTV